MKAAAAAAVAAALLAPGVVAQNRHRAGGRAHAERSAERPVGRWAVLARAFGALDLTAEQRNAIRALRDRTDGPVREHGRRILEARRRVEEALWGSDRSVERARAEAAEVSRLVGERTRERTMLELELFSVLTPEQRAELRRMRAEARERRAAGGERRSGGERRGFRGRRGGKAPDPAPASALAGPEGQEPADDAEPAQDPELADEATKGDRGGKGRRRGLGRLNLTPDQQERLRAARRQHGPVARDLARRAREAQLAVDDALLDDRIDRARVERLAAELGRAEAARETARFELEAAVLAVLTPEQAARLRETRMRRRGHKRF